MLQCFRDAIKAAVAYKNNSTDFTDEIMRELEVSSNIVLSIRSMAAFFWEKGL